MKSIFSFSTIVITMAFASCNQAAKNSSSDSQPSKKEAANEPTTKNFFIDVHDLQPGKVAFADVMAAHQKDLATEGKYDVSFIKFWVDEQKGKVYCFSSARDSQSVIRTHAEAHGMVPAEIFKVTGGAEGNAINGKQLFIDVHNFGAGKVNAAAVEGAHKKDLAVQKKYGVNFLNYWIDEKTGTVFCISQATDSNAIIKTHKEAHGLLPDYILQVKQGQ